jgi:predicted ATPase
MGGKLALPYLLGLLAEAHGNAGQAAEGLRVLGEALAIVDESGERRFAAELHRLKGELLLQQARSLRTEAESCFRQAIDLARDQQAKSLELRAVMSLSRLWQTQGKRAEAYQMLAEIYGWFSEGFETPDIREAKSLLAILA